MSNPIRYNVTIVRTYVDQFDVIAESAEDARDRCVEASDGTPVEGVTVIGSVAGDRFDLVPSVVVVPRLLDSGARTVWYLTRWLLSEASS